MSDKNRFGGGNSRSLYVPMSDVEQETLLRLREEQAYRVHIVDWGWHSKPLIIVGDHRLSIQFTMSFTKPEVPQPCYYFDMELWAKGMLLFKERQHLVYGGQPQMIGAGLDLTLAWDIAVAHIDPKVVKTVIQTTGLTSRLQDKDTGAFTLLGNMQLKSDDRAELVKLRQGEKAVRDFFAAETKKKSKG